MRKRIISVMLASTFVIGTSYQAFATPVSDGQKKEIETARNEYGELNSKISQLEKDLHKLDGDMNVVFMAQEENNKKIKNLESQSVIIEKEISELEKEIAQKQEVLGKRISGVYKSGGSKNYLTMLLTSESLGDFLGNINAISTLMRIDSDIIDGIEKDKTELDNKVAALASQKQELKDLNAQNEAKLKEFKDMEAKHKTLMEELNKEMANVKVDLTKLEAPLVKPLSDVINNPSSTKEELQRAVQSLQGLRNQLVSPEVDKQAVNAIEKGKNRIEELSRPVIVPPTIDNSNSSGNSSGGSTSGGGSSSNVPTTPNTPNTPKPQPVAPPASNKVEAAIAEAYRHIGKPYVFGSNGPSSFDCSSFTRQAYRGAGIELPRVTYSQVNFGPRVSRGELRRGDLVFTEGSYNSPSHVGIYLGNNQMIHASSSRGVVVASVYKFVTATRIV